MKWLHKQMRNGDRDRNPRSRVAGEARNVREKRKAMRWSAVCLSLCALTVQAGVTTRVSVDSEGREAWRVVVRPTGS